MTESQEAVTSRQDEWPYDSTLIAELDRLRSVERAFVDVATELVYLDTLYYDNSPARIRFAIRKLHALLQPSGGSVPAVEKRFHPLT